MKSILVFVLVICFSFCSVNEKRESHLKEMNLYGAVNEIQEMNFDAILESDTVVDLVLKNEHYYQFDINGNIIKEIIREDEGSSEVKVIYKYNDNNLNSEQLFYGLNDKLLLKNVYTYDSKGNILTQIGYDENNKEVAKANNEYDKLGRLSKMTSHIYSEKIQWTETYSYDKEGKLESKEFFPGQNNLKRIEFEYDSIGNPIVKNLFNNKNIGAKYYYNYSYDDKNNWIKCFEIKDDKAVGVRTRLISYY